MFHISGQTYEVVQEHKNAWNPEAFRDRYSEVLERYDYIVGDWGYNQLRLKGFFRDNHPKSTKDTTSSGIVDYINEYCNFGCAYFIVEKLSSKDPRYRQSQDNGDEEETNGAALTIGRMPRRSKASRSSRKSRPRKPMPSLRRSRLCRSASRARAIATRTGAIIPMKPSDRIPRRYPGRSRVPEGQPLLIAHIHTNTSLIASCEAGGVVVCTDNLIRWVAAVLIVSEEGFTDALPEGERPIADEGDPLIRNPATNRAQMRQPDINMIDREQQVLSLSRPNVEMMMLRQDQG